MEVDNEEVTTQRRKKKVDLELERQREEFRKLLQFPGNRYWLWRLLSRCHIFHTISDLDPHMMAVKSGKRDVGLEVLNEIFDVEPKIFTLIQQEAVEREKE